MLLQGVYYRVFSARLLTARCYCEVLTAGVLTAGVLSIGHLQPKYGVEKEVPEPDVE